MLTSRLIEKTLTFKAPAGTSRGTYLTRRVYYVVLKDLTTGRIGIGECAPLPKLSCDDVPDYVERLKSFLAETTQTGVMPSGDINDFPSIRFGLETALMHLRVGHLRFWDTPFARGRASLPINGLIWMGTKAEMHTRIEEKMAQGFRCLKLKIGAIDFDDELDLLNGIRRAFPANRLELRVDANGAFTPDDALQKLQALARYDIHSIEQPIRAGQWDAMRHLCDTSSIPIALDEELIGLNHISDMAKMLDAVKPAYIILKPSLHGSFSGCCTWLKLAQARGIGPWATSALESNVGLNAIAQWAAAVMPTNVVQGLGTGQLFTDNITSPLYLEGDQLYFDPLEEPEKPYEAIYQNMSPNNTPQNQASER